MFTTSSASVAPPAGSSWTPGPSPSTTTRCTATPATGQSRIPRDYDMEIVIGSIWFDIANVSQYILVLVDS